MYYLAVFSSRNETLYLAKMLMSNGYMATIVNTPKEAGLTCGISVKFDSKISSAIKMFISSKPFRSFVGIYKISMENGHTTYEKVF